ncbi:MAG: DNA polymerase Y family protein [Proteobacteria bacterium]|nr:MAG: DNA polymerase Y family protein [Pseudomonadota bacterium]
MNTKLTRKLRKNLTNVEQTLPPTSGEGHKSPLPMWEGVRGRGYSLPHSLGEGQGGGELWACLHFPQLPLEIFSRGDNSPIARVVSITKGNRKYALICNREALACGVKPRMAISAAYALCATLDVRQRNVAAEQEALASIAESAQQFTSLVSLVPPDSVLLEVAGSLTLFKGYKNLLAQLKQGLKELGYEARIAAAPTPLGATLLARNGFEEPVIDPHQLHSRLSPLPIETLCLDADLLKKFENLGLRCIGDCLRLPRDGLARRFGPQLLLTFDKILGKAPDPRQPFIPSTRFKSHLLLPAQVDSSESLLFATHRLLLELTAFLRARDGGIQELSLVMTHYKGPATQMDLKLVAPSRDIQHLRELIRVQFDRLKLTQSVEELTLCSGDVLPLLAQNQDLLVDRATMLATGSRLIEQLCARLGAEAVCGIRTSMDHRPEQSWCVCAPGKSGEFVKVGLRPVWLLTKPRLLKMMRHRPRLQGPLSLRAGPERIESGWWDEGDVTRDYFIAANPGGSRFWIFRERQPPYSWFLHGIFS